MQKYDVQHRRSEKAYRISKFGMKTSNSYKSQPAISPLSAIYPPGRVVPTEIFQLEIEPIDLFAIKPASVTNLFFYYFRILLT